MNYADTHALTNRTTLTAEKASVTVQLASLYSFTLFGLLLTSAESSAYAHVGHKQYHKAVPQALLGLCNTFYALGWMALLVNNDQKHIKDSAYTYFWGGLRSSGVGTSRAA
jgi:hypothetical protein